MEELRSFILLKRYVVVFLWQNFISIVCEGVTRRNQTKNESLGDCVSCNKN